MKSKYFDYSKYSDGGPVEFEDINQRLHFRRMLRGMSEPHQGNNHYDRMTRQLRAAVEGISDDSALMRYIADLGLTRQDVNQMLATITMHANAFIALSRLTAGYLKALNPPVQTCAMDGRMFFKNPRDARAGIVNLEEHGLTAKICKDMVDDYGVRMTFVEVNGTSDLDDGEFFDWLEELVRPLGGEILEAGYADDPKVGDLGGTSFPIRS